MKTTVVNGVLTSYELMLAIYLDTLDRVLDRAARTLFGSDAAADLVLSSVIIVLVHPLSSPSPRGEGTKEEWRT